LTSTEQRWDTTGVAYVRQHTDAHKRGSNDDAFSFSEQLLVKLLNFSLSWLIAMTAQLALRVGRSLRYRYQLGSVVQTHAGG
jgi:hypothetical protein